MALAVIEIFAGDVNERFIIGDVITAVGATLIQLLLTGCARILIRLPEVPLLPVRLEPVLLYL